MKTIFLKAAYKILHRNVRYLSAALQGVNIPAGSNLNSHCISNLRTQDKKIKNTIQRPQLRAEFLLLDAAGKV